MLNSSRVWQVWLTSHSSHILLMNLVWFQASLGTQLVKNLPAMQEMWVQSLGGEDPLEKGRQPTPVFLSGDSHRLRRLVGCSLVQFSCSVVSNSLRPHESQHSRLSCPSPSPGVHSLTSIKSVMPSNHLILCDPLLLLPPIPPSIRVFSNESTLRARWPKYWSFGFSIIPSKERPGLIFFRMDWLDLLAVQETLKSLLQHHSSKASIL